MLRAGPSGARARLGWKKRRATQFLLHDKPHTPATRSTRHCVSVCPTVVRFGPSSSNSARARTQNADPRTHTRARTLTQWALTHAHTRARASLTHSHTYGTSVFLFYYLHFVYRNIMLVWYCKVKRIDRDPCLVFKCVSCSGKYSRAPVASFVSHVFLFFQQIFPVPPTTQKRENSRRRRPRWRRRRTTATSSAPTHVLASWPSSQLRGASVRKFAGLAVGMASYRAPLLQSPGRERHDDQAESHSTRPATVVSFGPHGSETNVIRDFRPERSRYPSIIAPNLAHMLPCACPSAAATTTTTATPVSTTPVYSTRIYIHEK